MSHHIFTSGGAAHDVKHSVAPASVSFAILDTTINVSAYTDEDTTDTVIHLPQLHHKVRSGHSKLKRKLSVPWSSTLCANVSLSALSTKTRGIMHVFCCLQEKDYHNSMGGWWRCKTAELNSFAVCVSSRSSLTRTCANWSRPTPLYNCHFKHVRGINNTCGAACATRRRLYEGRTCPDASICSCCTIMCAYVIM